MIPTIERLAAETDLPIVLMSNQRDTPFSTISAIIKEVISSLEWSISLAMKAGVARQNIIIDPGIGFGKTVEQNLEIIRRLKETH